jgi:hypothetical protein
MDVINKKEFKKKEVVKVQRTQEDQDFDKFLGEAFTGLKE